MRPRPFLLLSLGLFAWQPGLSETNEAESTVRQWSQAIQLKLPESKLRESLQHQAQSARRASKDWLGLATLNLAREKNSASDNLPVENKEAEVEFPLKVFQLRAVFSSVAEAYTQQARTYPDYLAWQARGMARQLLNALEEKLIRAHAAEARLQQARKLYQLVQQRVAAGEASQLDASLAQQQLSQDEMAWVAATQALQAQQQQLALWGIHLTPENLQDLLRPYQHNNPDPEKNFPATTPDWMEKHPLWRWQQANLNAEISESRMEWWEAGNSPSVGIGRLRENSFESPEYTLTTLSVSIPLGRSPTARVAKARVRSQEDRKKMTLARLRLDLQRQWTQARANWQQAAKSLKPALDQWQAARHALKLTEQAWKQGETSLRELLLVQQAEREARLQTNLARQKLTATTRFLKHAAGE